MTKPRKASHIDREIGRRLRARRLELGMSQTELATLVGITFQQLQKHENGRNRVSAARLYEITRILNVPFEYFFRSLRQRSPRVRRDAGSSTSAAASSQLERKANRARR